MEVTYVAGKDVDRKLLMQQQAIGNIVISMFTETNLQLTSEHSEYTARLVVPHDPEARKHTIFVIADSANAGDTLAEQADLPFLAGEDQSLTYYQAGPNQSGDIENMYTGAISSVGQEYNGSSAGPYHNMVTERCQAMSLYTSPPITDEYVYHDAKEAICNSLGVAAQYAVESEESFSDYTRIIETPLPTEDSLSGQTFYHPVISQSDFARIAAAQS